MIIWLTGIPGAGKTKAFLMDSSTVKIFLSYFDILTEAQKRVVDLYYNEGMTQREIAANLGLGKSTIHDHLSNARKRVDRHLMKKQKIGRYGKVDTGCSAYVG